MKYENPANKPRKSRRVPPPPAPERRRPKATPFDAVQPEARRSLPPPPLPARSDAVRPSLDRLFEARPTPPFRSLPHHIGEAGADRAAPQPRCPEPPDDAGKLLNVPMICTVTDQSFLLIFREARRIFGKRYELQSVLTDLGAGGASSTLLVPVGTLNWDGIKCPHCSGACRPILCGKCQRLACDGRVRETASFTVFACTPSCGAVGPIDATLETISGAEGRYAQRPSAGGSSWRAQTAAPVPSLMLPKPR